MKYGEIDSLGRHRLMCGDATSYEDIEALLDGMKVDLVLTDPPYGAKVHIGYHRFKGKGIASHDRLQDLYTADYYKTIIGDESQNTARLNYEIVSHLTDKLIIWGGQYFANFLPMNKGWLVWHKEHAFPNHAQCELAWTSFVKPVQYYRQKWNGAIRQGSNTLNPRPAVHPTQKPVELHMKILEDFSSEGDVILDCFGGSGTTLIACELTGRTCLMMELSSEYCDIIRQRFDTLTQGTFDFRS